MKNKEKKDPLPLDQLVIVIFVSFSLSAFCMFIVRGFTEVVDERLEPYIGLVLTSCLAAYYSREIDKQNLSWNDFSNKNVLKFYLFMTYGVLIAAITAVNSDNHILVAAAKFSIVLLMSIRALIDIHCLVTGADYILVGLCRIAASVILILAALRFLNP